MLVTPLRHLPRFWNAPYFDPLDEEDVSLMVEACAMRTDELARVTKSMCLSIQSESPRTVVPAVGYQLVKVLGAIARLVGLYRFGLPSAPLRYYRS